jgi:hypothetical protein
VTATACVLCGAPAADPSGHEPGCPHFMRGPDPGGDPHEWPTLLEALEADELREAEPC